jgi:hypothetical protein
MAGICCFAAQSQIAAIRKGFGVRRTAERGEIRGAARAFASLLVQTAAVLVLAACSGLPEINGAPLPPEKNAARPIYRDLADIPDPPTVAAPEMNESAIETLTEDRAKTAQAAEDLRRQPFNQPDSANHPGF